MYTSQDHTFVICAYKESNFLEECICSLKNQTVKTNICMVTSTPNDFIKNLAEEYHIELYINEGEKGITQDWNFAVAHGDTELVTIAHQDDVYEPKYVECLLRELENCKNPLIYFTDYGELREGVKVDKNTLLKIKRILLKPLEWKCNRKSVFVRRRVLSLGSAICCPSVTLVKSNLKLPVFTPGFRSNEDWEAWERISKEKGEFVYCKEILMYHRIHQESETSNIIGDSARSQEDYQMFCKFWPRSIAKLITKVYSLSEKSNEIDKK